jgi:nucleoid DNA-binding protein
MAKDKETKAQEKEQKAQTKAQQKDSKSKANKKTVEDNEDEEYDGLLSEKTESRLGQKDLEMVLYDRLSEQMDGVTHAFTKSAVAEIFDILYGEMVINKNSVAIVNFGTFYPKFKDFRERRNPALPAGSPLVKVSPSISLKFAGTNWAVLDEELESWRAFDSEEPKEDEDAKDQKEPEENEDSQAPVNTTKEEE